MKKLLSLIFLFLSLTTVGQTATDWKKSAFTVAPEIFFGKTMGGNEGFPSTGLQKQLILNFGLYHTENPQQWAPRLKSPKTGFSVGITDFGNLDSLGIAISIIPFIEFKAFGSNRFKVLTGIGASYFTEKYDPENNPRNKAVTTDLTWAFRSVVYYHFYSSQKIDWRVGLGYSHHSNGHMRLLNIGYNSFLLGISADFKNPMRYSVVPTSPAPAYRASVYDYFAVRGGLGQNVLAVAINDTQNVYTFSAEYGRVYNNTFKLGIGVYSRLYQHYYNYMKRNESLVQEGREYEHFKGNPFYYATNFGISLNAEIFLNHVGIDLQLGYNLHKPAYKMDYRINEGWENTPREIPEDWQLGDLGSKYKLKYRISSRVGLKYYFVGMEKAPKNNFYIGAHLNANLGQADFSELSIGYVRNFNFRERD